MILLKCFNLSFFFCVNSYKTFKTTLKKKITMQVFNETMLIALASILASAQAEIDKSNVDISNEPQEFFEVDLSKFSGKRTINFGTRVFSNDFERLAVLLVYL